MNQPSVPDHVIHRVFGDSLGVIMNLHLRRLFLLQDDSLNQWKAFMEGHPDSETPSWVSEMFRKDSPTSCPTAVATSDRDADHRILGLWAFRNRVPISGHFELTGRCNLRCRHCYCTFSQKTDTLNTGQILEIIDQLAEMGTIGLVLTGGEMFCRPDILEILEHLNRRRIMVRINTNGTLIDRRTVEVLAGFSNIFRIHVSVYGSEASIHDRVTNTPGSFGRTMNALQMMKDAGIKLRVNCSIMKSNDTDFPRLKARITDLFGIPIRGDPHIFPRDDGDMRNLEEHLSLARIKEIAREDAREDLKKQTSGEKPKLCKAAFSFFSICEDGRLYPCMKMKRVLRNPLGNLQEQEFAKIWENAPLVGKIRDRVRQKLRECHICDLDI